MPSPEAYYQDRNAAGQTGSEDGEGTRLWIGFSSEAFHCALGKIDFVVASRTDMRFLEFVGKNLLFPSALRTLADKRAEVLEAFPSRAMSRRFHTFVPPCMMRCRPQ